MNAPTDWVSALAILAAGLVLGTIIVLLFNKRKSGAATLGGERDLELTDLEAKRDALLQQLRDPSVAPDERTRLELETADVLRRIDQRRATLPPSATGAASAASANAMNPTVKGFLWGAGSVAALAALGYFVMQSAAPRQEGGSLTGDIGMPQQQQQAQAAQSDPAVRQLESAVQRDPQNLDLRVQLAQMYLERDNLMGVFEQTQYVLERRPNDSRALTYHGLVRMAMGDEDEAAKMLQRAAQIDPKNLDSWVALAWVHAQSNRMDEAQRMIENAIQNSPENRQQLEAVFAQMKQQAAQPQTAQGGALPEGHPPVDGAPAAAGGRPAAPAGPSVQVTLDLDPAAKTKSGVLFVMARNPMGGPPVAVKRVDARSFPLTVELGSADSMMGQPLPAKFRLEARLDSDGDAATKLPTDPTAMKNDVAPGATVRLALK